MKHIFIGDIHGKVDAVKKALDMEGQKIFVGDFIDSWDQSVENHRECYRLVLESDAQCIFGNHELSYLLPARHRCSGYDNWRAALMREMELEIRKKFKPYILLRPDLLVSHAGITAQIWENEKLSIDVLPRVLEDWWPNMSSPMHYIGYARGGPDRWGGMFWCDFNHEFEPVTGLTQIFGHTRGKGIRCIKTDTEHSFCIDCLDGDLQFLELDIEISSS